MLSARYLSGCADDIVSIYSDLETAIVKNMVQRLARMGKIDNYVSWQAKILTETGALKIDINHLLAKYEPTAQKKILAQFTRAMETAGKKDFEAFTIAGRELSGPQKQILEATAAKLQNAGIVTGSRKVQDEVAAGGAIKTFSGLQRLTMTIADTASADFVTAANAAYMQVASGAFDYNLAIKNAVDDLAARGVHTVEYTDSGKMIKRSVESAVRTNVMTGINQTASQQTLQNCSSLETDLVEVSAHLGARPTHEEWQGKVYCLSGERDYIDASGNIRHALNFREACHYGEPDGICGINCRHSYYPYFEGTELQYSNGELDELKEATVKYNGQDITVYAAEQKLRLCERNIRREKRIVDCMDLIGADNAKATESLQRWINTAADISKQTGIRRDLMREYVGRIELPKPRIVK